MGGVLFVQVPSCTHHKMFQEISSHGLYTPIPILSLFLNVRRRDELLNNLPNESSINQGGRGEPEKKGTTSYRLRHTVVSSSPDDRSVFSKKSSSDCGWMGVLTTKYLHIHDKVYHMETSVNNFSCMGATQCFSSKRSEPRASTSKRPSGVDFRCLPQCYRCLLVRHYF